MPRSPGPLEQFRRICLAIPGASEGRHFGSIAFRVDTKMFATWDEKHGRIQLALESAHADFLIANDARFTRYPRARDVVSLDASRVRNWAEVKALVQESYELAAKTKPKPKPKKAAVKTAGARKPRKEPAPTAKSRSQR